MKSTHSSQIIATGIGFIAIILWSSLALFTTVSDGIPVFQLLFLTFFIGASSNLIGVIIKGNFDKSVFISPIKPWLLSVGGIFFYHAFYFIALFNAPPIEAALINYLWPLFIVLFSSFLPNAHLQWYKILGACVAFWGVAALLLLKDNGGLHLDVRYMWGYCSGFAAAITWGIYSVGNRLFAKVPSSSVVGYCYAVSLLGLLAHFVIGEAWVVPTTQQWLGILGLGLAPVGLAFLVWDYGTKNGDIQLLGILSYFAPLLSTLLLIIFTPAKLTTAVIIGCLGILFGAFIAIFPSFQKKTHHTHHQGNT